MNKAEAIEKISRQLDALRNLSGGTGDPEFQKWQRGTAVMLERIFGDGSKHVGEFRQVSFRPAGFVVGGDNSASIARAFARGKAKAEGLLQSMIDEVNEWGLASDGGANTAAEAAAAQSNRVFIVHGRNDAYKVSTARLLEQVGLDPIILHEQPNKGRTIIEKFSDFLDVGFAVVILSGDDVGGLAGDDPSNYQRRARQNVILELGYFLGHLGRERVCALYEDGVEIPSDYSGVLFVPLDKGGAWRYSLCRELQAAGFDADQNKVK